MLASKAVETLLSLPEYQSANRVGIYLSMPNGEISTSAIVHDALNHGKKVFVPYIHTLSAQPPGRPTDVMDMLSFTSDVSVKPDKWGIPTLSDDVVETRENCFGGRGVNETQVATSGTEDTGLDLVIMPGMAFDRQMRRLGHGKGYYDYFLQRYHEKVGKMRNKMPFLGIFGHNVTGNRHNLLTPAAVVGLALNEQLIPENQSIPTDETDWRLNTLVIGDGSIVRAE